WYAIFGEKWLNLHARTMTDIERTHNVGAYALAIVTAIIVNYALAWLIGRLNATNAVAGLKIALLCWFAFLFVEYSTIAVFSAFEARPYLWPMSKATCGTEPVRWYQPENHRTRERVEDFGFQRRSLPGGILGCFWRERASRARDHFQNGAIGSRASPRIERHA